jgi:iron complex outermembrane receptor protein
VTLNVGDAEIYGGELEASYRPITGLTLGLTASLSACLDHPHRQFPTVAVGQRLIDVPYETLTASVQYDYPLAGDMTLTVHADYDWTGRRTAAINSATRTITIRVTAC